MLSMTVSLHSTGSGPSVRGWAVGPAEIPRRWARRRHESLFASQLVTIADTVCSTTDEACALEALGDRHRLVFTRSGAAISRSIETAASDLLADPTHVLLLTAGDSCTVRHASGEPHECTTFTFALSTLDVGAGAHLWRGSAGEPCAPNARLLVRPVLLLRYHRLRRMLVETGRDEHAPVRAVEEEALALLRLTLTNSAYGSPTQRHSGLPKLEEDAETRRGHRHLAESVKTILVAAPGSPHRLDDLASMLGVSPSHLAHVFRAEVGLGLHQYLLQVRMALALDRLSDGASNLSRLALDLGFVTHSHFSKVFRRYFGMPPSRVREFLRGG
jgi:AraC-like DNA-binding protein